MSFLLGLDRALKRLYRLCGWIAAACLVALMLCVLGSIVTRLAGLYVGGLTEFSGYFMAAASYFALAYTFRSDGHIRVTMLLQHAPERLHRPLEILCLGVATVFTAYLAWHMGQLAWFSWLFGSVSEGADALPLWMPQVPAALGAGVLAVSVLHALIEVLAGRYPVLAGEPDPLGEV